MEELKNINQAKKESKYFRWLKTDFISNKCHLLNVKAFSRLEPYGAKKPGGLHKMSSRYGGWSNRSHAKSLTWRAWGCHWSSICPFLSSVFAQLLWCAAHSNLTQNWLSFSHCTLKPFNILIRYFAIPAVEKRYMCLHFPKRWFPKFKIVRIVRNIWKAINIITSIWPAQKCARIFVRWQTVRVARHIWRVMNTIASLWCQNVLGYFFLDTIDSFSRNK